MMIDVTIAADFDGDLAQIFCHMNPLAAGATLLHRSDDKAVFALSDTQRIVITGTGLDWTTGKDGLGLVGGRIDALIFRDQDGDQVTFATLQTTGDRLWAAFEAERDATNPVAVVDILTHHCWTYHGSDLADLFPKADLGVFGVPDLGGNDKIFLYGGDDDFFTGAARDTILGGLGNDSLSGGTGNDLLVGGSGNDLLLGGADDDALEGGVGADTLMGGDGADTLEGGAGLDRIMGREGDDRLSGGAQADVFGFAGDFGGDVITDFQIGVDHLDFDTAARLDVIDQDGWALIRLAGGSVLLLGVAVDALTPADLL